jgi:2-keto-3-deoxy-L-rhamnonate aldolase RhmA
MFPVVRFFHDDYASCAAALDAGAAGIIAPHIEEVEQVKELVKQCRFREYPLSWRSRFQGGNFTETECERYT